MRAKHEEKERIDGEAVARIIADEVLLGDCTLSESSQIAQAIDDVIHRTEKRVREECACLVTVWNSADPRDTGSQPPSEEKIMSDPYDIAEQIDADTIAAHMDDKEEMEQPKTCQCPYDSMDHVPCKGGRQYLVTDPDNLKLGNFWVCGSCLLGRYREIECQD